MPSLLFKTTFQFCICCNVISAQHSFQYYYVTYFWVRFFFISFLFILQFFFAIFWFFYLINLFIEVFASLFTIFGRNCELIIYHLYPFLYQYLIKIIGFVQLILEYWVWNSVIVIPSFRLIFQIWIEMTERERERETKKTIAFSDSDGVYFSLDVIPTHTVSRICTQKKKSPKFRCVCSKIPVPFHFQLHTLVDVQIHDLEHTHNTNKNTFTIELMQKLN